MSWLWQTQIQANTAEIWDHSSDKKKKKKKKVQQKGIEWSLLKRLDLDRGVFVGGYGTEGSDIGGGSEVRTFNNAA